MRDTQLSIINTDLSYENHIFKNTLIDINCLKNNIFKLPNGKIFNGKNYNLSNKDGKSYTYIAEKPIRIELSLQSDMWESEGVTVDIYGLNLETPILSNVLVDTGSRFLVIPDTCFTKDISENYPIIDTSVLDEWGNIGNMRHGPISLLSSDISLVTKNTKIRAVQYQRHDNLRTNLISCDGSNWNYNGGPYNNIAKVGSHYLYDLITDESICNDRYPIHNHCSEIDNRICESFYYYDGSNDMYCMVNTENKCVVGEPCYKSKYYEINTNELLLYNYRPNNIYKVNLNEYWYNLGDTKLIIADVSTLIISDIPIPIDINFGAILDSGGGHPWIVIDSSIYNDKFSQQEVFVESLSAFGKKVSGVIEINFSSDYKYTYHSWGIRTTYIFDRNTYPDISPFNPGMNVGTSFFKDNGLIIERKNSNNYFYLKNYR
tara:strand:+ start:577 stop:1872 length:1296 start_codon:yes stop_codon:yes gene_type:complete